MRLLLALSINLVLLVLTFLFLSHLVVGILLAISLLIWFFWFLWRRQNVVRERVEQKVKKQVRNGSKVVMPTEHVMFRAVESSGYSQTSGMGYIALTEDYLFFELILMDLVITVPTSKLKGAEFVRRLKGVSPIRQMLRILFVNEKGEEDSIAIQVKDMEKWKRKILQLNH